MHNRLTVLELMDFVPNHDLVSENDWPQRGSCTLPERVRRAQQEAAAEAMQEAEGQVAAAATAAQSAEERAAVAETVAEQLRSCLTSRCLVQQSLVLFMKLYETS